MSRSFADIRLKRVYDPPAADDGARVLVDRLWPRGVRKEDARLTLWLKDVAPDTELRRWYGHDPARWEEFYRRYRAQLAANEPAVEQLRAFLASGRLTLVYAAHDTAHSHALVLSDHLRGDPPTATTPVR